MEERQRKKKEDLTLETVPPIRVFTSQLNEAMDKIVKSLVALPSKLVRVLEGTP